MTSLPDFLLAMIEADEAVARKAAGTYPSWQALTFYPNRSEVVSLRGDDDSEDSWTIIQTPTKGDALAQHIARHDPARILAQCASYRAVVELHGRPHECSVFDHNGEVDPCHYCLDGDECSTLRALASIYSDHPDFKEEWSA